MIVSLTGKCGRFVRRVTSVSPTSRGRNVNFVKLRGFLGASELFPTKDTSLQQSHGVLVRLTSGFPGCPTARSRVEWKANGENIAGNISQDNGVQTSWDCSGPVSTRSRSVSDSTEKNHDQFDENLRNF